MPAKRIVEVWLCSMQHRWRLWFMFWMTSGRVRSCHIFQCRCVGWIISKRANQMQVYWHFVYCASPCWWEDLLIKHSFATWCLFSPGRIFHWSGWQIIVLSSSKVLLAMGHKRDYAEMLQNLAKRIYEDHNGRVMDKMYDLFTLLGVDSQAARLTLHHAFNKVDASMQQWMKMCLYQLITDNPDSTFSILQWTTMLCAGQRSWIGYLLTWRTMMMSGWFWSTCYQKLSLSMYITQLDHQASSSRIFCQNHDFIEAANWIYPGMITVLTYMFHKVEGMTMHPDLNEVET